VNRIWEDVPAMRAQIAELGRDLLKNKVQMVTLESTSDTAAVVRDRGVAGAGQGAA